MNKDKLMRRISRLLNAMTEETGGYEQELAQEILKILDKEL